MPDSSSCSSDGSSFDKENESVLSAMSPITPRTSVASPDVLTLETTEESKRSRRNSNVRFREVRPSSTEERPTSPGNASRDERTTQAEGQEVCRSPAQPSVDLERSRLEDHINSLEDRIRNLELPRLSDFSEKGDASSERSGLSLETQWMTWQEYVEPINRATNILEVLIEKPHTNTRRKSSIPQAASEDPSGILEVKNIERIRFRSPHINIALQQITEQTFPSLSCFTIHRPFKILLFYRDAIEEYVSDLENIFNRSTYCKFGDKCRARVAFQKLPGGNLGGNPGQNSTPEDRLLESTGGRRRSSVDNDRGDTPLTTETHNSRESLERPLGDCDAYRNHRSFSAVRSDDACCKHEESEELLAQVEAITHLRALLKFMREDMREIYKRHEILRSSQATKISFIDIWHLFMAGDLVVTNDESNQMIYRVSILPAHEFFSSRRPVKKVKLRSDGSHQQVESVYSQESMSVLHIDVFYCNFDGRTFGPVERRYVVCSPNADFWQSFRFNLCPH